jgi:hypothetical protein
MFMKKELILLTIFIVFFWGGAIGQNSDAPKIYVCSKTDVQIQVDGLADELVWKTANWTDDFVDIEGDKKPAPPFRTRAKMLWDDKALYILAEMDEDHIWATLQERDQIIYYDNDFEVFIDPDGDNHNYFELEVNALATAFDLFLNKPYITGGRPLIGWDISGLECAVNIEGTLNNPTDIDKKWTLEIAIPWRSLVVFAPGKLAPQNGDIWRMNFSRVQWNTEVVDNKYKKILNPETGKPLPEDNWVWSPQGVIDMHLPEYWGYVYFWDGEEVDDISHEVVDPYFAEKQVLLDYYQQQKSFYSKHDRYAESLYELNKQGRNAGTSVFIESTSKQFLIHTKTPEGQSIFIDHEKKLWME